MKLSSISFFLILLIARFSAGELLAQSSSNKFAEIRRKAISTKSDVFLVYENNKIISEFRNAVGQKKINIQSITKNIVSLAIGKLFVDGKIKSIDDPISNYVPKLAQTDKGKITVRQLLNHTSGLYADYQATEDAEDKEEFALKSAITYVPGQKYEYNNNAMALLGIIVRNLTGKSIELYTKQNFFDPMKITDYEWLKDKMGHPACYGGIYLSAEDLAKFGELVLGRGVYMKKVIIASNWFDLATPSVKKGYPFMPDFFTGLWWSFSEDYQLEKMEITENDIAHLISVGISDSVRHALNKIKGMQPSETFYQLLPPDFDYSKLVYQKILLATYPVTAIHATGGGGQYLVMFPAQKIIVVRLVSEESINHGADPWKTMKQEIESIVFK